MKNAMWTIPALLTLALVACGSDEQPAATSHHEEEADHVKLTPEQIGAADIAVATAGPANIRERLPLYGVIAPNAERVREVTARFPGVVRTVSKRVGDSVEQGEILASIESNESLKTYNVVAPLAGAIGARNANPGEQTGDKSLFTVVDLSTLWVELSLFPRDVAKVRVGQTVRVGSADANLTSEGKIVYVAPFGSSSNQTLTARVLLDNREQKWRPGLYVTAEVTLANEPVALAVSNQGLQTLEDRNVIFVRADEGFEPRSVRLGRSDGEWTEVLAGLEPGVIYATKNSFILKAELGKGETEHGH